jgi:hypothetical protein
MVIRWPCRGTGGPAKITEEEEEEEEGDEEKGMIC